MSFPEEGGMGGWGWARGSVGAISGGSHVPVMEGMQGVQGIPGAATQVGVVVSDPLTCTPVSLYLHPRRSGMCHTCYLPDIKALVLRNACYQ